MNGPEFTGTVLDQLLRNAETTGYAKAHAEIEARDEARDEENLKNSYTFLESYIQNKFNQGKNWEDIESEYKIEVEAAGHRLPEDYSIAEQFMAAAASTGNLARAMSMKPKKKDEAQGLIEGNLPFLAAGAAGAFGLDALVYGVSNGIDWIPNTNMHVLADVLATMGYTAGVNLKDGYLKDAGLWTAIASGTWLGGNIAQRVYETSKGLDPAVTDAVVDGLQSAGIYGAAIGAGFAAKHFLWDNAGTTWNWVKTKYANLKERLNQNIERPLTPEEQAVADEMQRNKDFKRAHRAEVRRQKTEAKRLNAEEKRIKAAKKLREKAEKLKARKEALGENTNLSRVDLPDAE